MAKQKASSIDFPFYRIMWQFYSANKREIKKSYTNLTRTILVNAEPSKDNPNRFLRKPQYEAFEMYVFLKEYLANPRLADLFDDWHKNIDIRCHTRPTRHAEQTFRHAELDSASLNKKIPNQVRNDSRSIPFTFDNSRFYGEDNLFGILDLTNRDTLAAFFNQLSDLKQDYANYIFALTMGTGKTILMALCIFYEFLLAHKYPKDERFCHNALVLAPDTTVLQSLKEIQTFDKAKVFTEKYANELNSIIKFHFLDEDGVALSTMDGSDFNLIISTSQKIILKKKHKEETAQNLLFKDSWQDAIKDNPNADLYMLDDDSELMANQRYQKLTRLKQLGIYVDEAHHAFGKSLKSDMLDRTKETSLRLTIDGLVKELDAVGTKVVACYNFTGTPYIENRLMPEVVYEYGLKEAIDSGYLKKTFIDDYANVQTQSFVTNAVESFVKQHRNEKGAWNRYENMLPKMALFATTIDELNKELKPALEKALRKLDISEDSILVNVGDDKLTKQDDLREFLKLDTVESKKQFILLVGKGKEGWNCRSLFSVALFRKPKSTIFVLQATMRCLRSITDTQQTGQIFLSTENLSILQDELNKNFKVSVNDLKGKDNSNKKVRHIYVREKVPVKIIEQSYEYKITELKPGDFTLFGNGSGFDFEKYRRTKSTHSLSNIDSASIRKEVESNDERTFTEYSLVAELSLYLTQHEISSTDSDTDVAGAERSRSAAPEQSRRVRWSPVQIRDLLEHCIDGIDTILEKVNYSNAILYDWVVPELFKQIYAITYEKGEKKEIIKWLTKDPPKNPDGTDGCYNLNFDDDLFVEESAPNFCEYNQVSKNSANAKKSFNLSGYGFDSGSEKSFFVRNLFNNKDIKHIWFTGMLTNGQSEFYVHYIDPELNKLRSYYPDFLIEMNNGKFYIVEIKGENLIDRASTQAKIQYAKQMYSASGLEYVFIPSKYADMILQEFVKDSDKLNLFEEKKPVHYEIPSDYGLLKVASSEPKF
ncbi:MAG: DEAD/DEAH box helicase family protein [Treponema sp.]|nr:DEAD/DEAH box helicase family protein [Treponema sp.]